MELINGNQVADIRLMQMFPWFGVLKYAKDEMSLMANAKFELFRDAKLQVFYDVQRNWYELYKIQKDISISEKNIEILKIIERLALVKIQGSSIRKFRNYIFNIQSSLQVLLRTQHRHLPVCRLWGLVTEQFRFFSIKSGFFINADWSNGIIFSLFRTVRYVQDTD